MSDDMSGCLRYEREVIRARGLRYLRDAYISAAFILIGTVTVVFSDPHPGLGAFAQALWFIPFLFYSYFLRREVRGCMVCAEWVRSIDRVIRIADAYAFEEDVR